MRSLLPATAAAATATATTTASGGGGGGGYRLELGCGNGDWLAAQASASPKTRWVGVELMMTRAHLTGARFALARLQNAAVLHADATDALERWVAPASLEAIYANHPEPPRQAAARGGASAAAAAAPEATHMLDDRLLSAAAAALRPGGTLTIVTDNTFYAELLLDALARRADVFRPADTTATKARAPKAGGGGGGGGTPRLVRSRNGFSLFEAPPGAWCRHEAAGASSYFDRLWKTGLSVHSKVDERYVLHVSRRGPSPAAEPAPAPGASPRDVRRQGSGAGGGVGGTARPGAHSDEASPSPPAPGAGRAKKRKKVLHVGRAVDDDPSGIPV